MKKILCLLLGLVIAGNASAQTVIIVNNNDSRPVYAAPAEITLLNRSPAAADNSLYYKNASVSSSEAVISAGAAAFVIGALLHNDLHRHDRHHAAPILPKRHPLFPCGAGGHDGKGHGKPHCRL